MRAKRCITAVFAVISCAVFGCIFVLRPQSNVFGTAATEGRAECVMEASSRRILYESNGDSRLPMASTTKILTAITVLSECADLEEKITIPRQAEGVEGSSVYLKQGDTYTARDLLYGLMLRSGNDCAVALALHYGKTIGEFAVKMNKIAEQAGALDSQFSNPHGLPCENHYTTARDLASITCFAMQNPIFREIVATKYYDPCGWKNKNKLLFSLDGSIGVKTGYTKEAGRCLVSAVEREGMTIVSVVLACGPMYERSEELLCDAYNLYHNTLLLGAETPLKIQNGNTEMRGVTHKNYYYPLADGEKEHLEIKTRPKKDAYDEIKGEIIGQFEIYLSKRLIFSGNLYKL